MNRKSPRYVLVFMALICLVFGTAIAVVNYATLPLLKKNEVLHKNTVLCNAFLLDVPTPTADAYAKAVAEHQQPIELADSAGAIPAWRRTSPGAEMLGFLISGMGFWDRMDVVVVLRPDLQEIVNIQIMDQKETPGLGAFIEEKWFTDRFKNLAVDWSAANHAHIIVGPASNPNAPNRVDGVTGATQTSMALMNMMNNELARIRAALPTVHPSAEPPTPTPNP